MVSRYKRAIITVVIVVGLVAAAAVVVGVIVVGKRHGEQLAGASGAIPSGYHAVQKRRRTSTWLDKLKPWHTPTEVDEALGPWPAGTQIVKVKTEGGEEIEIAIMPDGEVAVPDDATYEAEVWVKPRPFIELEARPFGALTGGLGGVGGIAGLDLLRVGPINVGPGITYDYPRESLGVALAGAYEIRDNIDLRGAFGYGTGGYVIAAGVGVGIRIK